MHTMNWNAAVVSALLACACRSPVNHHETEADAAQVPERTIRSVLDFPLCRPRQVVETSTWARPVGRNGAWSFALPPAFERDAAARFPHGGERWTGGERDFSIIYGQWETAVFPREAVLCREDIGGEAALVVEVLKGDRRSIAVWFSDPRSSLRGRLYRGTSPPDDGALLWTIVSGAAAAELGSSRAAR